MKSPESIRNAEVIEKMGMKNSVKCVNLLRASEHRSSHPKMFCEKGVVKKRLSHRCCSVNLW